MEGRLDEAIGIVIDELSSDEELNEILSAVLDLSAGINYMDWSDWDEYSESKGFKRDLRSYFKIKRDGTRRWKTRQSTKRNAKS